MTFLEELTAHKGGLVLLKTQLYWYGGRGWDGTRGRICLLMDATAAGAGPSHLATATVVAAAAGTRAAALLVVDGCPYWVWVSSDDLELL
jgi:hypothetical protein